jgi:hypothetical protein
VREPATQPERHHSGFTSVGDVIRFHVIVTH